MRNPTRWTDDNLLRIAAISGKCSVRTQYAVQVLNVSDDGRFVTVVHNTLEWESCTDGDTIMINEFGKDVLCSPAKPWVITDVPVEEMYERGQWKVRVRPKVGDRGILSVFYHDIQSLKEKGGFQAPDTIRVMAIESASYRPGLPNHADVNAESEPYPSDDEWELKGNGVKVKLTSPVDGDSQSPNKMEVSVGTVSFTVTVPQDGDPTVVFDAPNGAITVNTKTAVVNAATSVKIDTPATTITGTLQVDGAVTLGSTLSVANATTIGSTLGVTGAITGNATIEGKGIKDTTLPTGVTLGTHTHGTPPSTPTPTPGS